MIKVISATEANRISLEQWVNIYELSQTEDAEFYECCEVKDLVYLEERSEYGL